MLALENIELIVRMMEEIQNSQKIEHCNELLSKGFVSHTAARGIPTQSNLGTCFANLFVH